MDKIPEKKTSSPIVVAVLVLLPVLYVLSSGPAVRLISSGSASPSTRLSPTATRMIIQFYFPLEWFVRHNRWLKEPISNYISLWQKL
jgi:hypothetical protein